MVDHRFISLASSLSTAVLVLGLAASGCDGTAQDPQVATAGGNPSAGPSGRAAPAADEEERRRQFLACMRAEGVELSHPDGDRGEPTTDVDGAERLQNALSACREYAPGGGVPTKLSPEDIEKTRLYAVCMREQGVTDYPDPDPATGQPPLTDDLAERLKHDASVIAADEACRDRLPQLGGGGVLG